MSGIIDWARHFDHIYCFHYLPDTARVEGFTNELRRVGILDSGIFSFVYTTPDPYEKKLLEKCPEISGRHASALQFVNLGLASARTLREALALGYQRVLFLEDDIRFLKDLDELEAALANIPQGWDIVQFDKFMKWEHTPESYAERVKKDEINSHYFDAKGEELPGGGCFMATPRGMANMLKGQEQWRPGPMDQLMNMNGSYHAVAKKNLAVQVVHDDAMLLNYLAYAKANTHHKAYKPQGLRYEDYAVPEGYGYDTFALTATA